MGGPNETFSSPPESPAHSPSYSRLPSREASDVEDDSLSGEPHALAEISRPPETQPPSCSSDGGARWWESDAVTRLESSVQRAAVELAVMVEVRLSHIIPNALPPLDSIIQWMESHLRGASRASLDEDELVIRSAIDHFSANTPLPYRGPFIEPTIDSTAQSAAVALLRRIRRITDP